MATTHQRIRPSLTRHLLLGYLEWFREVEDAEKCYIIVDTTRCPLPEHLHKFVDDQNMIILDISGPAVRDFEATAETLSFSCKFTGVDTHMEIEWPAIYSIYCITRDQQPIMQMMMGGYTPHEFKTVKQETQPTAPEAKPGPGLRVVK